MEIIDSDEDDVDISNRLQLRGGLLLYCSNSSSKCVYLCVLQGAHWREEVWSQGRFIFEGEGRSLTHMHTFLN